MEALVRKRLDMGENVLVYFTAHPPAEAALVALHAQLVAAVDSARTLVQDEQQGRYRERGAGARKLSARKQLRSGVLRHLVRAGQVAAKTRPELGRTFRSSNLKVAHRVFLATGRTMVQTARDHAEAFEPLGITVARLDRAHAMLDQFEAASQEQINGRLAHVDARSRLTGAAARILEIVELADGLVRDQFADDPDGIAAWESARSVAGPFRPAERPAEEPEPPGPAPDVVVEQPPATSSGSPGPVNPAA